MENKEVVNKDAGDNKPKIVFENAPTYGDQIKALVDHYTGLMINDFVLEEASKQIRANNKLIDKFTQDVKDGLIKPIQKGE